MDPLTQVITQAQGFKEYLKRQLADPQTNYFLLDDMVGRFFRFINDWDKVWFSRWQLAEDKIAFKTLKYEQYKNTLFVYLDGLVAALNKEVAAQKTGETFEKSAVPENLAELVANLDTDLKNKQALEQRVAVVRAELTKQWNESRVEDYIKRIRVELEKAPEFNRLEPQQKEVVAYHIFNSIHQDIKVKTGARDEKPSARQITEQMIFRFRDKGPNPYWIPAGTSDELIGVLAILADESPEVLNQATSAVLSERDLVFLENLPTSETLDSAAYLMAQMEAAPKSTMAPQLQKLPTDHLFALYEASAIALVESSEKGPAGQLTSAAAFQVFKRAQNIYIERAGIGLTPLLFKQFVDWVYESGNFAAIKTALGNQVLSVLVELKKTLPLLVPRQAQPQISPAPVIYRSFGEALKNPISALQIAFKRFWDNFFETLRGLHFFPFAQRLAVETGNVAAPALSNIFNNVFSAARGFPGLFGGIFGGAGRATGAQVVGKVGGTLITRNPWVIACVVVVVLLLSLFFLNIYTVESGALLTSGQEEQTGGTIPPPPPGDFIPPEGCAPAQSGERCCVPNEGYCSLSFTQPIFGDQARNASQVCLRESAGGFPAAINDGCLADRSAEYSVGLFQINILVHTPSGLYSSALPSDQRLFSGQTCGQAFGGWDGTLQDHTCFIADMTIFDKCRNYLIDPNNNIEYAKITYDNWGDNTDGNLCGWRPWTIARDVVTLPDGTVRRYCGIVKPACFE